MDKTPTTDQISLLTRSIEASIGRTPDTPRDFTFLRECIFARLNIYLSESTLKRVWGYMPRGNVRTYTLDVLSSFLGFASWQSFLDNAGDTGPGRPSDFSLGRHIYPDESLKPGQSILLVWEPDRRCEVRYLGSNSFQVTDSANTRLLAGDTFTCPLIIEGEPLYLTDLRQDGRAPASYICGKIAGIRFQLL